MTLLEDLKKWLKKAKQTVDQGQDPTADLASARAAATNAIANLNGVLGLPEPGEPTQQPTWDVNTPHQSIGACLGLMDECEHLHALQKITALRESLVTLRWAIQEILLPGVGLLTPGGGDTGGGRQDDDVKPMDLLDSLRDWLKKARKKVNQQQSPRAELVNASAAASDVINTLSAQLGDDPPTEPDQPLIATTNEAYMLFCEVYFNLTDLCLAAGNKVAARSNCVNCKWSIDSFILFVDGRLPPLRSH